MVRLEDTFKKGHKSEWSPEGAQTNPEGEKKYKNIKKRKRN